MTSCAACGGRVSPTRAMVYVRPDGSAALVLCRGCQPNYDRSRRYSPDEVPSRSRISLSNRGVDDAE